MLQYQILAGMLAQIESDVARLFAGGVSHAVKLNVTRLRHFEAHFVAVVKILKGRVRFLQPQHVDCAVSALHFYDSFFDDLLFAIAVSLF